MQRFLVEYWWLKRTLMSFEFKNLMRRTGDNVQF